MLILGFQHTFAMFGATVLVPLLTGLNVSTTLLMAGLGTLLFHLLTKGKVPAFLGSSFAFLGGYAAVAPMLADGSPNVEMLPYACGAALRLRRCCNRGTHLCADERIDPFIWRKTYYALFPAGCNRSDYHLDRTDSGANGNPKLLSELVACIDRTGRNCSLQHLG